MSVPQRSNRSVVWRPTGVTLVEVVVATLVVSLMLVAALNAATAARLADYKLTERNRALLLAQALLSEIVQQAYDDPVAGVGSFGLETGESTGNRSLFDDVDDYNGWSATPPQNRDGTAVAGTTGYEQAVSVAWVQPTDLSQVSGSETGLKQIKVTIRRNGRPIITLMAYRTRYWENPVDLRGGS